MLIAIRDRVAAMKAAGLSEEETIARKPTAAFDEAVGEGFMSADMFAGIVYRTL